MQTLSIANDQPRPTILSGRIPSLDGLRAVSILLVVVCHLAATVDSPLPGRPSWYFNGAVGVDVFFAISGFLITTLLLRESERSGTISISRFYLRRALRILPAFWFYLTVLALLNRFGWVHLVGRDWIAALTYTVNFFLPTAYAVRHIWSLSVEEHFYIVWPLLFAFLGRNRATKLAIVYLLSEPVIRWLTWRYFRGDLDIDFVTFARLDAIAAGCVMAVVARIPTSRSPLKRLDENPAVWFFAALFILLLSVCVLSLSGKYGILLRPTVNALAICVMIWTAARFPDTSFGRLLNWAPLAWLGRLSYSLYIWHQVFLDPSNGQQWMCKFPQNLGLGFAAAVASYYIIERPFLNLKNRRANVHVAAAEPAPSVLLKQAA